MARTIMYHNLISEQKMSSANKKTCFVYFVKHINNKMIDSVEIVEKFLVNWVNFNANTIGYQMRNNFQFKNLFKFFTQRNVLYHVVLDDLHFTD